MTRCTFRASLALVLGALASACLPMVPKSESETSTQSSGSKSNELGFSGATKATNLDGTRISIEWSTGSDSTIQGYIVYESTIAGDLIPLGRTGPRVTRYVHAGLNNGSLHYYVVRAIDSDGQTDTNTVLVGTVTYSGITNAVATGSTTATVTFPTASQAAELHVYGSARGGTSELLATVAGTATSANLTGLKSGTTYAFSVKAVSPQGSEDANTVTKSAQTESDTATKYQGALAVKAYGASPTAPSGPTQRQVSITWLPFSGANTTTSYALIRTIKGAAIDSTVTAACTASTQGSCRVCTATGATAKTCIDTNVAASPTQYDYTVVLVKAGWPEEMPANDSAYRITVPLPPENMVLVQRDAANYEMCQQLKKTSDPLNYQRCPFTGLGDRPYNTGPGNSPLNLETGYYDFGYNLFIDRFEVGCNWTPGVCSGFGAANGDCWGTSVPSSAVGAEGTIYYNATGANCYVKYAGSWQALGTSAVPSSYRAAGLAQAPGAVNKFPPISIHSNEMDWQLCQASIDPDYGAKRLMRRREFVVAAAWPSLNGEPGALTDSRIVTLEDGSANYTSIFGCNTNTHSGIATSANFNGSGYELSRVTAGGPDSFVIGSQATRACVSRFGAQDLIGNVQEALSDGLGTCSSSSHTCVGTTSVYDSGNADMATVAFNGIMAPGGGASGLTGFTLNSGNAGMTQFLPTLGLPGIALSGAMTIGGSATQFLATKLFGDYILLNIDSSNGTTMARTASGGGDWLGGAFAGRWNLNLSRASNSASGWNYGLRCAVPAD